MEPIAVELSRLADAADSGGLSHICARHDLDLVVLFGSAVELFDARQHERPAAPPARTQPGDIDLAVRVNHGSGTVDQLTLLQDLFELTGSERIDLMLLRRAGPLARHRALGGGRKLFEAEPHLFAEAQMAAALAYFDTEPLRKLGLARLVGT